MADSCVVITEKQPDQLMTIVSQRDPEQNVCSEDLQTFYLVTFTKPTDPENPKDWSVVRKWLITIVLSATGFNRILVSTIMAPALSTLERELHMNAIETLMSMSVYLFATALGALIISPMSEVYGRKPILHSTNIWFLVWNIACGFARNKEFLIAARFQAGFGAGAAYVLSSSVLGDIWNSNKRGRTLGFALVIQVTAAAIGPIVGALITQNTSWRWIFWSTSLVQAIITITSVTIFRETYAPLILRRKAKRRRTETGNDKLFCDFDRQHQGHSAVWILRRSLSRPIRLLLFHPIVLIQAFVTSFSYGITYLVISTYANLWTSRYGQSISVSGLHYIATCIGEILGAQVGGWLMDFISKKLTSRANGNWTPEHHLPMMLPGALLTAIGFLWYGWSAQTRAFWINVDIGSVVLCFGMQLADLPLRAYVIDTYPDHASSAQAGSQVLRSLAAFGFPLFAPSMYTSLGYGWANTMLAFISLAINLPAFFFIWFHGPKLRAVLKTSF